MTQQGHGPGQIAEEKGRRQGQPEGLQTVPQTEQPQIDAHQAAEQPPAGVGVSIAQGGQLIAAQHQKGHRRQGGPVVHEHRVGAVL